MFKEWNNLSRDFMGENSQIKELTAGNVHESVLNLIKYKKPGKILDLAAGPGNMSLFLKKLGFEVIAGDINIEQFEVKDVEIHEIDANKRLPFDSETFDYFISIETIEHLKNPWMFISEANRVLKSGGTFIITTPNIETIQNRIYFLLWGRLNWFGEEDITEVGHITPIYSWIFEHMIKDKFKIKKIMYNDGEVLGILPRIGIIIKPFKFNHILFGQIKIMELQKI